MRFKGKEFKYLKIAEFVLQKLKYAGVPEHFSKFSKRTYNNLQHIVLQVFRQKERKTYRDFVDFLEIATELTSYLKLQRVPHFTTLQKFAQRIRPLWIQRLIAQCCKVIDLGQLKIGVDSTGFSLDYASHHYVKRINRNKPDKGYVKLSAAGCLNKLFILALVIRKRPAHDNKDFRPLVLKAAKQGSLSLVTADKAYDAEKNHELCSKIGAESVIPLRRYTSLVSRVKGKRRKRLFRRFPEDKYHQRSKIESAFGALKRRFGSVLKSRSFKAQKNELLFKVVAYNATRLAEQISWLCQNGRAFLQSP